MKPIELLLPLLKPKTKVLITTHANPDADALGSSLALYQFLKGRKIDVTVVSPNQYPDFLFWMPFHQEVICAEDADQKRITSLFSEAELIFCLDFSGSKRVKNLESHLIKATGIKIIIDHHLDPEDFAAYGLWNVKAAATAELIYDFILMAGGRDEITPDIANCIYAGINTDTGSFKHPSTTSKVHRIVADLIDLGANVNMVSRAIYDTNSLSRLRFLGYALLEKLIVKPELGVAYFTVTKEDFERFQLKMGDTEGLVNYALSIQGVIMAAIIIERDDEVKLSFRSVENYQVNTFATKHFAGGGHKNAAGGHSELSATETVRKFENLIKDFKTQYIKKLE